MIGSLPKLIALAMVLLLVGSTFIDGIIYFIDKTMKNPIDIFKRCLLGLLVPYIRRN